MPQERTNNARWTPEKAAARSNNALWTPEKAAARAAGRAEEKRVAAEAKALDPRTDMQKAGDARRALAALPNPAGDTLAIAASVTRGMFDRVQPAWKEEPVAPAPAPPKPIPDRQRGFVPIELSPRGSDSGNVAADASFPLKLVATGSTSFKVLAGEVAGFSIAETAFTGITSTKYVWVEVTQGYDSVTGIWTPTAATLATPGAAYGIAGATTQIVRLGYVTCSAGLITSVSPMVRGSQGAGREGPATGYVDRNWLV